MNGFTADSRAPVYCREEVVVDADPETVWKVMALMEDWPQWNPDVREASISNRSRPRLPLEVRSFS